MITVGIISEYNPFHNGHRYQIEKIREKIKKDFNEECIIISIMSGNFTQRGDMAIFDKYERSKIAIKNGVNLVLELPIIYSLSGADIFAKGALNILNNLKCIDFLAFSVEDIDKFENLKDISNMLKSPTKEYTLKLKENLKRGNSYMTSATNALEFCFNKNLDFIKKPNNILAFNYLKYIENIKPLPIQRINANHDSLKAKDNIASAMKIRNMIFSGKDVNKFIPYEIKKSKVKPVLFEDYFFAIKNIILNKKNELFIYPEVETGLDNRIYNNITKFNTIEEFINEISTKRYTKSRIRRILMYILLDIKKEDIDEYKNHTPNFIRVLALDNRGRKILKKIKNNINIFTNYNKDINNLDKKDIKLIEKTITSDNIYDLSQKKFNTNFHTKSFYLDN